MGMGMGYGGGMPVMSQSFYPPMAYPAAGMPIGGGMYPPPGYIGAGYGGGYGAGYGAGAMVCRVLLIQLI